MTNWMLPWRRIASTSAKQNSKNGTTGGLPTKTLDEYQKARGHYTALAAHARGGATGDTFKFFSHGTGIAFSGFLFYVITVAVKALLQKHPLRQLTREKKQLVAVLLASGWISVAAFIAANDRELSHHPVNLIASVFVFSLPAILFGGVSFWWFGRSSDSPTELLR